MNQTQQVWTVEDWQAQACDADQIGTPKEFWTLSDAEAGHCHASVVGMLKPSNDFGAQVEGLTSTPKQLRRDVLEAYRKLGGVRYLMKNPMLLEKLLVKVVTEDVKPVPPATVQVNLSWIQPGRLSYRDNMLDITPALEANKQVEAKLKE